MPAAASSISVSAVLPRSKAAVSAARISAALTTGERNQSSEVVVFFLLELLLLFLDLLLLDFFFDELERLLRELLLVLELRRDRGIARTKSGPSSGWESTSVDTADAAASGRVRGGGSR